MDTECIPPINTSLKKMDNFFVLERKLERIRRRQIRNQYKRRPRYIGGSKSDSEYLNTNISLKMVKSDNDCGGMWISSPSKLTTSSKSSDDSMLTANCPNNTPTSN